MISTHSMAQRASLDGKFFCKTGHLNFLQSTFLSDSQHFVKASGEIGEGLRIPLQHPNYLVRSRTDDTRKAGDEFGELRSVCTRVRCPQKQYTSRTANYQVSAWVRSGVRAPKCLRNISSSFLTTGSKRKPQCLHSSVRCHQGYGLRNICLVSAF